jgi:hypothetical protein
MPDDELDPEQEERFKKTEERVRQRLPELHEWQIAALMKTLRSMTGPQWDD